MATSNITTLPGSPERKSDAPLAAEQECFQFLDLPGELRNQIYDLHLDIDHEPLKLRFQSNGTVATRPVLGVNSLRACKLINDEAKTFPQKCTLHITAVYSILVG